MLGKYPKKTEKGETNSELFFLLFSHEKVICLSSTYKMEKLKISFDLEMKMNPPASFHSIQVACWSVCVALKYFMQLVTHLATGWKTGLKFHQINAHRIARKMEKATVVPEDPKPASGRCCCCLLLLMFDS